MPLFSKRKKHTRKPSPLMLKVEEIDTKLDTLLASQQPRQQPQEPVSQSPVTQHEQGFEPFSEFAPMEQEGSDNG